MCITLFGGTAGTGGGGCDVGLLRRRAARASDHVIKRASDGALTGVSADFACTRRLGQTWTCLWLADASFAAVSRF